MELIIKEADLGAIFAQCRRESPNEACGILAGTGGRVEKVYPMRNTRPGPTTYEMEPQEQFAVLKDIRSSGLALVSIYHSHPDGEAYPSGVDVAKAYWPGTLFPNYPDAVYLIVSLRDRERPVARGYRIEEGTITEVRLAVEGEGNG